jgi:Rrf2 family nitric oxide-sensitive transcriptional repressor
MWLNQQTLDAVRILMHLATRAPALCRAADVADATGITVMNVRKTVHALGDSGLVTAVRGRQGGVRLAHPPEAVPLAAIVRAFEPKDCPAGFLSPGGGDPRLSAVLFRAHRGFFQPLETTTLADLLRPSAEAAPANAAPPEATAVNTAADRA